MSDRHAPQSTSADSTTVIGKGIHIEGEVTGSAPIEVWGSMQGVTGTEGRFWVREGGQVGGKIAAREVIIEGQVEGEITAEQKVEFRPTCKVQGDVMAKKVAIAEGAVFDGRIRMSDTVSLSRDAQARDTQSRDAQSSQVGGSKNMESQAKDSQNKDSQNRDSQGKDPHGKNPQGKGSQGKGLHGKGPHGNKSSRN